MAADRFASLSTDELQAILEDRDSANTKNCIEAAKKILQEYCRVKDVDYDELITRKSKLDINEFLINFYAEVRKKNGDFYSRTSMISLRFGVQRAYLSRRKFDIINDEEFKIANEMYRAVLTQIKRSGKGTVQHKEVISDADIEKLYSSGAVSVSDPNGLQSKVFIDIMFYTCRRGRENLRNMKKTDFILKNDAQGRRFFVNVAKYETKNHRGADVTDDDSSSGRIYEIPGSSRCPVSSLEKYLSKLNPNSECFWQRPKRSVKYDDNVWYDNMAVGHNTLGNFMKTISTKANLSQIYTYHCIRATCITALDNKGMEARHIMSISGHKSESSVKSYSRNVSEEKRHEMCAVLQNVIQPVSKPSKQPKTCTITSSPSATFICQPLESQNIHDSETINPGTLDNFLNQVDHYEVQEIDGGQFLHEISVTESPGNNKENSNTLRHNNSMSQIGPLFQNVKLVQIHYHVNKR